MNQDSKEFFKLVSAVSQEQALASAVVGRQLQMRWLKNLKDNPLVVDREAFVAEVISKHDDAIFCKLIKTHQQGISCDGWFTVKDFVSTFQICFYTKWI